MAFRAHDILEQSPKDFKICEIQHMLTKAEEEGFETCHPHPPPLTSTDVVPSQNGGCCIKFFKRIWYYYVNYHVKSLKAWLTCDEDKWLEEMRGHLSTTSTFIATITFQGLINPPGGFIQQDLPSSKENTTSSNQVLNVTSSDDPSAASPSFIIITRIVPDKLWLHPLISIVILSSIYFTLRSLFFHHLASPSCLSVEYFL